MARAVGIEPTHIILEITVIPLYYTLFFLFYCYFFENETFKDNLRIKRDSNPNRRICSSLAETNLRSTLLNLACKKEFINSL